MHVTAIFLLMAVMAPAAGDLESRIAAYWDRLAQQDKASALEFVTPETRNHFINRRESSIVGWRLVKTEQVSPDEAVVEVQVDREIPGTQGVFPIEVVERWVRRDQWQVVIRAPQPPKISGPISFTAGPQPVAGQLAHQPEVIRVPFFNPRRLGIVFLANGLEADLRVSGVEYDRERFRIAESPEIVPAGESRKLVLEYTGDEIPKNLKSRIQVKLQDDQGLEQTLDIGVVYNYFSDGARGLFGLTREEADKVRREDKLKPAISNPAISKAQEEGRRQREEQPARPPAPSGRESKPF